MTVEETLKELVGINSVSARPNLEIIQYLSDRVSTLGLSIETISYMDSGGVEKKNLIARTHGEVPGTVELALVGHTDTVPFASDWVNALELTLDGDRLVGRGACDTKGFIAAALTAVESVDLSRLRKPLALIFTADEEVGCIGAKKLAETRPFVARNAIVGEPTSLRPMRAGKGYCLADVKVHGREGHSAYPAVGASAIYTAARLIERIERISQEVQDIRHEGFDPPYTSLNVGVINGGTAKNIIPGLCTFTLEWRPVPGQAPDLVLDLVRKAVDLEQNATPGIQVELRATRIDGGMETPADAPLVTFLEKFTGNPAGTIAFGTEAPQMIELGADAVVFGPGDIQVAHRTGEYVPNDDLNRCVEVLSAAIAQFCS
jgi:acetylornithine deacetylase